MKVLVLMGSARPQGATNKVANWVYKRLTAHKDVDTELVDLNELELPFYNETLSPNMIAAGMGDYANPRGKHWADKVGSADAVIFVTPEYNHGVSALTKNAIDWVGKEWHYKPAIFVSFGSANGARAVEQLRLVVNEVRMVPARDAVLLHGIFNGGFDDNGDPTDKAYDAMLENAVNELVKLANVLKPLHA